MLKAEARARQNAAVVIQCDFRQHLARRRRQVSTLKLFIYNLYIGFFTSSNVYTCMLCYIVLCVLYYIILSFLELCCIALYCVMYCCNVVISFSGYSNLCEIDFCFLLLFFLIALS